MADFIVDRARRNGLSVSVFDAVGDPLVNSTRYSLAAEVHRRRLLTSQSFHPADGDLSVRSDVRLLRSTTAPFLHTGKSSFRTGVDQRRRIEAAAKRAGFEDVASFHGPGGRAFTVWERSS